MTGKVSLRQRFKHKLFYVYAAYGFGVPALIVGFAAMMDNMESIPKAYKPGFGVETCLMSSKTFIIFPNSFSQFILKNILFSLAGRWLSFFYLYSIISIIMIVNIILFSITAYRIYSIKKEAVKNTQNSRRHSHTNLEREKWEKIP